MESVSSLLEDVSHVPAKRPRGRPKGSTRPKEATKPPEEEANPGLEITKLLADPELTRRDKIQLITALIKWRAVQARIPMEEAGSGFSLDLDDDDNEQEDS